MKDSKSVFTVNILNINDVVFYSAFKHEFLFPVCVYNKLLFIEVHLHTLCKHLLHKCNFANWENHRRGQEKTAQDGNLVIYSAVSTKDNCVGGRGVCQNVVASLGTFCSLVVSPWVREAHFECGTIWLDILASRSFLGDLFS